MNKKKSVKNKNTVQKNDINAQSPEFVPAPVDKAELIKDETFDFIPEIKSKNRFSD